MNSSVFFCFNHDLQRAWWGSISISYSQSSPTWSRINWKYWDVPVIWYVNLRCVAQNSWRCWRHFSGRPPWPPLSKNNLLLLRNSRSKHWPQDDETWLSHWDMNLLYECSGLWPMQGLWWMSFLNNWPNCNISPTYSRLPWNSRGPMGPLQFTTIWGEERSQERAKSSPPKRRRTKFFSLANKPCQIGSPFFSTTSNLPLVGRLI